MNRVQNYKKKQKVIHENVFHRKKSKHSKKHELPKLCSAAPDLSVKEQTYNYKRQELSVFDDSRERKNYG